MSIRSSRTLTLSPAPESRYSSSLSWTPRRRQRREARPRRRRTAMPNVRHSQRGMIVGAAGYSLPSVAQSSGRRRGQPAAGGGVRGGRGGLDRAGGLLVDRDGLDLLGLRHLLRDLLGGRRRDEREDARGARGDDARELLLDLEPVGEVAGLAGRRPGHAEGDGSADDRGRQEDRPRPRRRRCPT